MQSAGFSAGGADTRREQIEVVVGTIRSEGKLPLHDFEMDEALLLPVSYNGKDLEFPFRIERQGYVTRFLVRVGEVDVTVERDEGGDLRALVYNQEQMKTPLPDPALLKVIVATIEQVIS